MPVLRFEFLAREARPCIRFREEPRVPASPPRPGGARRPRHTPCPYRGVPRHKDEHPASRSIVSTTGVCICFPFPSLSPFRSAEIFTQGQSVLPALTRKITATSELSGGRLRPKPRSALGFRSSPRPGHPLLPWGGRCALGARSPRGRLVSPPGDRDKTPSAVTAAPPEGWRVYQGGSGVQRGILPFARDRERAGTLPIRLLLPPAPSRRRGCDTDRWPKDRKNNFKRL